MSLTAEQLSQRHHGIGSSDAPAAIGLSPFKTPLELWSEKVAPEPPQSIENDAMYWGSTLEPIVANEYSRRTGSKLRRRPMKRCTAHPWMTASLDRTVDREPVIVECKTTRDSSRWGDPGTDEMPPYILAQCVHQLAVARTYDRVDVPVLFLAERRFEIYTIERNTELVERLVEVEKNFWSMVEERTPPPATTVADLSLLYPHDTGERVLASVDTERACQELANIKLRKSELDRQASLLEFAIKDQIADGAFLVDEQEHVLATWKEQTARRLDTKSLAIDHHELCEQYRRETPSRRFLLKTKAE